MLITNNCSKIIHDFLIFLSLRCIKSIFWTRCKSKKYISHKFRSVHTSDQNPQKLNNSKDIITGYSIRVKGTLLPFLHFSKKFTWLKLTDFKFQIKEPNQLYVIVAVFSFFIFHIFFLNSDVEAKTSFLNINKDNFR